MQSSRLLLAAPRSAHAQKLPASTTIGTNPAGTVFYAVSAGLAKVISGAGPMQSIVQPYTGSSTFMPLLDSGEIDFGIINAVEIESRLSRTGEVQDQRQKSAAACAQHKTDHARLAVDR